MTIPSTVEALLANRMRDVLQEWCIDDVPTTDRSRANHAIVGKPTSELRDPIVISVHTDHPLGPGVDKDKVVMGAPRSDSERPFKWPPESWGGMRTEQMIGAVQINIREDLSSEDAVAISGAVSARVKNAINQDRRLAYIADDFGNHMQQLDTFKRTGYASGGGNVSIYIHWVDWRAHIVSTNMRDQ